MNKEYVVVSKTDINEKINELNKELIRMIQKNYSETSRLQMEFTLNAYKEILSQSTQLEPIIENSFDAGSAYCLGSHELFKQTHPNKQEYITNLKLDI